MRLTTTALAAAAAAAALALAGCGTTVKSATGSAPPAVASSIPGVTPVPAPSDSPSVPPSSATAGAIGTTFTVTSSDGTSYDVTLDKVSQRAALAPYETLTNQADHAAAAEFTIKGDTGQASDDANSDADAIGSDQTEYQYAAISLTVPNFSSGEFTVAPGQVVKGWVAFELPPGVSVGQVQWAPGFGSQAATWQV